MKQIHIGGGQKHSLQNQNTRRRLSAKGEVKLQKSTLPDGKSKGQGSWQLPERQKSISPAILFSAAGKRGKSMKNSSKGSEKPVSREWISRFSAARQEKNCKGGHGCRALRGKIFPEVFPAPECDIHRHRHRLADQSWQNERIQINTAPARSIL